MDEEVERAARELLREEMEARERARRSRGPRSRLVDAIMVMLLARPMKSSEIAGVLGYDSRYVASYLSYWRSRGYVEYESGYWYLTPLGEEYARNVLEKEVNDRFNEFASIAQRILSSIHERRAINSKSRGAGARHRGPALPFIADFIGKRGNKPQDKARIAECALESIAELGLSSDEIEVYRALLDHYAKWGTTYMYLDQLQEEMEAGYDWLLKTLRELQTKGLVYLYRDPRLGLRVGLSKKSKEVLKACGAGGL